MSAVLLSGCTSSHQAESRTSNATTTAPSVEMSALPSSVALSSVATPPITAGSTTTDRSAPTAVAQPVTTAPVIVHSRPIPHGDQAVDALGIEILVPASLILDPPCAGRSVSRPTNGLTYGIACEAVEAPTVEIGADSVFVSQGSTPIPMDHCLTRPILDGETGCFVDTLTSDGTTDTFDALWPRHDVALRVRVLKGQTAWAEKLVATARWVPIDRHGCVATRTPVGLPVPAVDGSAGGTTGSLLPTDTATLSVCWYSANRLIASATVTSPAAIAAIARPSGVTDAPGIGMPPSYTPDPAAPVCDRLDRTEGIVFLAHRPAHPDSVSTAQLADCVGRQIWTDGAAALPVGEPLASALRSATGFLITHGYSVTS